VKIPEAFVRESQAPPVEGGRFLVKSRNCLELITDPVIWVSVIGFQLLSVKNQDTNEMGRVLDMLLCKVNTYG
jgi:hypothetical protein